MRRTVRALLESRPEWTVCGEAIDGEDALAQAQRLRPDVAVLDMEMPKLHGLETARRIRAAVPTVQILVLTMHDSAAVREQARRAGARDVVSKSDAHRTLVPAIESLLEPDMAIPLAGSVVRQRRHIGAFFRSERERYAVLGPFIAEGIACGEKAVHIIDPPDRDLHLQRLREAGVDVAAAEGSRQLELLSWEETYLRDGCFDQQAMAGLLVELLGAGAAEGYPLTRGIAHMEWALGEQPGVKDLVDYERRLNGVLAGVADVIVCAYDVTKFSAALILDALRAHPAVILGGALHDNPFYEA